MSAYPITKCWAAQGCPATAPDRVPRADPSRESDHYVPPADDGGLIGFLTSTQMVLAFVVGLITVFLLVSLLWAERRGKTVKEGEHEESG
ncbi:MULTISPECIES: hypothetical protein [unclassified Streptomyces]|uniref:hypothetical protein n=1 Tax=unclassified Streptomyces TaxID=2593676 RepID=UPI002E8165B6|nr:hypothetical protein [Streptomyces sp. NBC_00589]WTI35043.1 hypothetical protein OIC96_08600 [Streptomyces sp. NBC_00775]WUB31283.1 hypothetical protein OHA51_41130 [Streptomyces sp. NBC_00589]